jgi:cobalt/nickel transport system permease protein
LAGNLLLRTYDRAQRLHQAMVQRGFEGEYNTGSNRRIRMKDMLYLSGWVLFFLSVRYYNIPSYIGFMITGVGK